MSDFTKESQEKYAENAGYFYHQIIALKAENSKLKTEVAAGENSHYRSLQLWGEKEDRLKSEIDRLKALPAEMEQCSDNGAMTLAFKAGWNGCLAEIKRAREAK